MTDWRVVSNEYHKNNGLVFLQQTVLVTIQHSEKKSRRRYWTININQSFLYSMTKVPEKTEQDPIATKSYNTQCLSSIIKCNICCCLSWNKRRIVSSITHRRIDYVDSRKQSIRSWLWSLQNICHNIVVQICKWQQSPLLFPLPLWIQEELTLAAN
jgi:hypothetical protein